MKIVRWIFGLFLSVWLLFSPARTAGQTFSPDDSPENDGPGSLITDRPDQNEAPELVPRGWIQMEFGASRERDVDRSEGVEKDRFIYHTALWKYGCSENFEIRLISEYLRELSVSNPQGILNIVTGFGPLTPGCKIFIRHEKGIMPEVGLISHLVLPYFGEGAFRPDHFLPRFRFCFRHTLSERVRFSYNLGMDWENKDPNGLLIYTTVIETSLNRQVSVFGEAYGFIHPKGRPDNRLDGGLMWLLTRNMQLDCSAGVGLVERSPDYFVSVGFSMRGQLSKKSR